LAGASAKASADFRRPEEESPMNALRHLLQAISAKVEADPAGGLMQGIGLFKEIAAGKHYVSALNRLLAAQLDIAADNQIFTSGRFLALEQSGSMELILVRYPESMSHIYSSPNRFLQVEVSGVSCTCDRYAGPSRIGGSLFDSSVELALLSSTRVAGGEVISKDLDEVIDFHNFTRVPALFLRVTQAPERDFEWAFDRSTLRARSYSTIRLAESNLCSLFDLLGAHGDAGIIDLVSEFAEHPLHFVRWKAVQTVARLDCDRGLALARLAVSDEHPHVRRAAQVALDAH
jgi:hypothetical protein